MWTFHWIHPDFQNICNIFHSNFQWIHHDFQNICTSGRTFNWKLEHLIVAKSAQLVRQTFDIIDYAQMSVTRPIRKTTKNLFAMFALSSAKIWVKNMKRNSPWFQNFCPPILILIFHWIHLDFQDVCMLGINRLIITEMERQIRAN